MKRWLFWIYYINPFSYGMFLPFFHLRYVSDASMTVWAAIMESEFSRLDITCDGNYIVPRGGDYPSSLGPNQSCTLYGATPGSDIVSGSSYVAAAFNLDVHDIWRRNLLVLIGWFIFFQITQIIAIEFFQVSCASF